MPFITELSDVDSQRILDVARETNAKRYSSSSLNELELDQKRVDIENGRSDIKLKKLYAEGFLNILRVQLITMNLVFVAVGFQWLKLAETTINIFMTGTLAEVFGVVFVITRYLFPKK